MAKSGIARFVKILVAVGIAGGVGAGVYFWTQKAVRAADLTTVTTSRGELAQNVTATGDLQPVTTVDVSSQISGQILEVLVDFNTPVKAGDLLARIDPATYDQRLKQAEADLASAQASNRLTRLNTDRARELHKKSLVSDQELDQADAQLAQSNATLLTRNATVADAKVNLSRCTLYAPIDGIVMDRIAEKGKMVAASLNAPTLFTIVNDLSKMRINAAVAEADVGSVEVGQPVTFTVDAFQGRTFRGKIVQIRNAPKAAQNVVTYQTIIEVDNDDLKLKPGMTANVTIVVAQRASALRVPNSTLRVRIPDDVLAARKVDAPKPAAAPGSPATPAAKPMTEEERRAALSEIMREAGFTRGGGPPSPEVLQKVQELARARGIEFDPSRMGRGRGERGDRADRGSSGAATSRNLYRLVGTDPKTGRIEQVSVKLGITDGIFTEVLEGLKEGDVLVTGVASTTAVAPTAPQGTSPLMGGRVGGPGGRGR